MNMVLSDQGRLLHGPDMQMIHQPEVTHSNDYPGEIFTMEKLTGTQGKMPAPSVELSEKIVK